MSSSLRRIATGIALVGVVLLPGCHSEPERPLNLLLISLDTVRADRVGAYGYERPTTPVIDAFAERSLLFENAYSQAPVTATSHMSLMTGVLPATHAVRNRKQGKPQTALSPELPTLASILGEHGYRCVAFVAGGNIRAELGFERGFHRYQQGSSDRRRIEMLRRALENISDEPFFAFFHTYAAHDPYVSPLEKQKLFNDPEYSGEIVSQPRLFRKRFPDRNARFWAAVDRESPEDRKRLNDLYDAGVLQADEIAGKVLKALEASGASENTVVVLLSDHGEQFGEHGGFTHSEVYEELLRVPLILSIPGERGEAYRGRRVERVVRLVDVMPTLLTLMDIPVPGHLHGHDLLSRLELAGDDDPPAALAHYLAQREYALRREDWKLIGRYEQVDGEEVPRKWELYDLEADPGEQVDLLEASPREYAEVFARLRRELQQVVAMARRQGEALKAGESIELDEETRRELEALGYL